MYFPSPCSWPIEKILGSYTMWIDSITYSEFLIECLVFSKTDLDVMIQHMSWIFPTQRRRDTFKQIHSIETAVTVCVRMSWGHSKGHANIYLRYLATSSLVKL